MTAKEARVLSSMNRCNVKDILTKIKKQCIADGYSTQIQVESLSPDQIGKLRSLGYNVEGNYKEDCSFTISW